MMVTVAYGMVLQHELAGERCIAVERYWRGAIQLLIAESTDCRGRGCTVGCQQGERGFLFGAVILFRVVPVHRIDDVPGNTGDWLAGCEQTRKVDLDRIDAGNMMHHDADLPSILGEARLPLCFGERGGQFSQGGCAGLRRGRRGSRIYRSSLLLAPEIERR